MRIRLPKQNHVTCHACGGDGWLPSLPEGNSDCPYCQGTGLISRRPARKQDT